MSNEEKFDRPDESSKFLDFVAKEFRSRGTPLRIKLASKVHAKPVVTGLGIRVPEQIVELSDIEELRSVDLPDRVVLKYAHGWSARGVMLLEKLGPQEFFCHLAQRTRTLEELIRIQQKIPSSFSSNRTAWILEEFVASTIAGKPIPFDYKFYCFQSKVGLIVQIDRNTYPVKVNLLGPDFSPLQSGRDYMLISPKAQLGVPLVPLHAAQLLDCAKRLSACTDSPFVSIDMYDSPGGPVFGEFTFSPGGTHKRMWLFKDSYIDQLDQLFVAAEQDLASNPSSASRPPAEATGEAHISPALYSLLAGNALNGSSRAASRLAEHYAASPRPDVASTAAAWSQIAKVLEDRVQSALRQRVSKVRQLNQNEQAGA